MSDELEALDDGSLARGEEGVGVQVERGRLQVF